MYIPDSLNGDWNKTSNVSVNSVIQSSSTMAEIITNTCTNSSLLTPNFPILTPTYNFNTNIQRKSALRILELAPAINIC